MESTSDNEEIQLFLSEDILSEYKEVLSRPKLNISKETQQLIIDAITGTGVIIIPSNSSIPMTDESDRKFYDTAKACNATLVTGNIKHYPTESFIMTPADFVAQIQSN